MEKGASITALMSAFTRAYHAKNSVNPVFDDSKASELLTDEEYNKISSYILSGAEFFAPGMKAGGADDAHLLQHIVNTSLAPTPLARAKYCEEVLRTAVRTGTEQYVILGAGLDTFAFRNNDFVNRYRVFEVDHPLTQADKIERINRAGWSIPENLSFVSADFSADSLARSLLSSGFDKNRKTLFSWLGVSYYLSYDETCNVLSEIADISSDGSSLVFDAADEHAFSSDIPRVRNMLAMAMAGGEPMRSAYSEEELVLLLDNEGFLVYELLEPSDIQKRWFEGRADGLEAFPHIRYVNAVYKK